MFGIHVIKGSGWLLTGEGRIGSKGESGEPRVIVGVTYNYKLQSKTSNNEHSPLHNEHSP